MLLSAPVKGLLAGMVALAVTVGCAPRPRMCTASTECADKNACVAGRCQLEKATVKPAVDSARRLVLRPIDLAVIGGEPAGDHHARHLSGTRELPAQKLAEPRAQLYVGDLVESVQ